MRLPLQITLALVVVAGAADAQAQNQNRFRGMDSNNDGVITRAEWRGNDRAFRNQDWDGNGILSGDEVRQGAQRQKDPGLNRAALSTTRLPIRAFPRFDRIAQSRRRRRMAGRSALFTRLDTIAPIGPCSNTRPARVSASTRRWTDYGFSNLYTNRTAHHAERVEHGLADFTRST